MTKYCFKKKQMLKRGNKTGAIKVKLKIEYSLGLLNQYKYRSI